jgi:hypothetical protein
VFQLYNILSNLTIKNIQSTPAKGGDQCYTQEQTRLAICKFRLANSVQLVASHVLDHIGDLQRNAGPVDALESREQLKMLLHLHSASSEQLRHTGLKGNDCAPYVALCCSNKGQNHLIHLFSGTPSSRIQQDAHPGSPQVHLPALLTVSSGNRMSCCGHTPSCRRMASCTAKRRRSQSLLTDKNCCDVLANHVLKADHLVAPCRASISRSINALGRHAVLMAGVFLPPKTKRCLTTRSQ